MGDRTITQVAKDLDLTENSLREWVKRADIDSGKGPPDALTTAEREELARLRRENKRLAPRRRASEVRFHRPGGGLPVGRMCRVLGVNRSGFYAWKKRPTPARVKADAQLAVTVAAVHQRSRKVYGSPRVHEELKARGVRVGRKRVARLMQENGLEGRRKRRFK